MGTADVRERRPEPARRRRVDPGRGHARGLEAPGGCERGCGRRGAPGAAHLPRAGVPAGNSARATTRLSRHTSAVVRNVLAIGGSGAMVVVVGPGPAAPASPTARLHISEKVFSD